MVGWRRVGIPRPAPDGSYKQRQEEVGAILKDWRIFATGHQVEERIFFLILTEVPFSLYRL